MSASNRNLTDKHIEQRELNAARRRARREHPQPCDCPYCITAERVDERIKATVAAHRAMIGEPPF